MFETWCSDMETTMSGFTVKLRRISDAQIADTRNNILESNLSVLLTPAMG
jgi:hypothetical protein